MDGTVDDRLSLVSALTTYSYANLVANGRHDVDHVLNGTLGMHYKDNRAEHGWFYRFWINEFTKQVFVERWMIESNQLAKVVLVYDEHGEVVYRDQEAVMP